MGVLDSSYIKAMGVESAGLKKLFLFFQDTLLLNVIFFDMGSLREGESLKPVRNPTIPGYLCPPCSLAPNSPNHYRQRNLALIIFKGSGYPRKGIPSIHTNIHMSISNIVAMRVIVSKIISWWYQPLECCWNSCTSDWMIVDVCTSTYLPAVHRYSRIHWRKKWE